MRTHTQQHKIKQIYDLPEHKITSMLPQSIIIYNISIYLSIVIFN